VSEDLQSLIEEWDGLGVVASHHRETGSWIFIALHDATLGRPTGGCRLRSYRSPAAGLRDAMRLAEGMTYKWAAMDFRYGGGKSVLAVPGPLEGSSRRSLFTRLGHVMNALNGGYGVGEDLGTTPEDMAFLATVTPYVAGVRDGEPAPDPGPFTAAGVHAGIAAAVAHVDGSPDLDGVSVLVQGVGDVGRPLAKLLGDSGAKVIASDIDAGRARAVARECGGTAVDRRVVYETPCDVYAPCAVGATVNARTVQTLRCRIVAGSANNQLEVPEDAERLRRRGILYAPDYVINAGGIINVSIEVEGEYDEEKSRVKVENIYHALKRVFEISRNENISTNAASNRLAKERLSQPART